MKINFDLSHLHEVINDVYYPLLENQDRYLIMYGGAGAGKSHFAAQKILIRIIVGMKRGIRHRFLALRKTQPAVRKSVFALFNYYIYEWGLQDFVRVNRSDMSFHFIGGSEILCGGLDEAEKLKSIEGVTSVWLEETTEFKRKDFTQIDLRLRGKTSSYKQIILSFNPIGKFSWLYNRFFEKSTDKTKIVQTTYRDNRFIDKEYIEILEGLKNEDETTYEIYDLGKWGVLKNIIYSNYDLIDKWPEECDEIIYGEDFGFNNESAIIEIGIKDNEYYLRELLYQTHLTNQDLIEKMKVLIPDRDRNIYADSAEPARIEEIKNAGFNIYSSDKSVKDGIDFVKRQKLHILKSSVNLIKEIGSYKYKEDKNGNVMDEPVKFRDHILDGLRYALYTHSKETEPDIFVIG